MERPGALTTLPPLRTRPNDIPADTALVGGRADYAERCHMKRECAAVGFGPTYFARLNRVDGTQPSLPSSSETFHQIPSFSTVG